MERHVGTVVWFNSAKAFGFLNAGTRPDVSCHFSAIEAEGYKELSDGDAVEFSIVTSPGGKPQAENVIRRDAKR